MCDAFIDRLALRPTVMQPSFGMAEVCTCMTYNNEYGPASNVRVAKSSLQSDELLVVEAGAPVEGGAVAFMDLGPVSPGVEIRIADMESGRVCLPERQVGRFQIKGPCVMQGYKDHPVANAESFVGDGWFDSGDLGFVHNGCLLLTGRAKEMIIIRGANFYCYEIEDVVLQVAGTVPARVAATSTLDDAQGTEVLLVFFVPDAAAVPDGAVAALHEGLEATPELRELAAAVRRRVTASVGVQPRAVVPVTDAAFHRTTSGKIQRGAFKRAFEAGAYADALATLEAPPRLRSAAAYVLAWAADPLPNKEGEEASPPARQLLLAPRAVVGTCWRHEATGARRGAALVRSAALPTHVALVLAGRAHSAAPDVRALRCALAALQQAAALGAAAPSLTILTRGALPAAPRAPRAAWGVGGAPAGGLLGTARLEV